MLTDRERERERERERGRERERETETETEKERAQYDMLKMHGQCMSICIYVGLYHLYKCIHAICNYVYTYIYIYTYTYTNIIIIHRYTFIYIYICTTLYVYIYIHTYMFIYMFIMNTSPYDPEEVKLLGCNSQTKQSQAKPSQAILKGNFLNRCVI